MVFEVLVSALSMAVWAIGLYYHPNCTPFLSGCLEPANDVLILDEAHANIVADEDIITTVEDAVLCDVSDAVKISKHYCEEAITTDLLLPRASLIEREAPFPWSLLYERDIMAPTVIPSAVVNDQRRWHEIVS